ncbi:MAG: AEC family transporter, partial [Sutterella sp.]|nr:AEC family transporter [Sutterella sp.]
SFGSITSPLALFFIGMTIWKVGFDKLRHMPREIWLILFSCFVLRPLIMYLLCLPFDMEPIMRKVFVAGAALPVSSVLAVLSKNYGADEEYASEAIGASTIGILFALPVLLFIVNFV